jgi:hypothetical protein
MGGSDDPSNIIELTIDEHAEAHRILYVKYGKQEDYIAWKGLSGQIHIEEIIKSKCSIGGHANKGVSKTEQHKAKIANALTGSMHTEERKSKISKAAVGNKNSKNHSSKEYKQKQSEAMKKAWAKRKIKKSI